MVCGAPKDDETHLKDFMESTSLHGARYLAERNIIRKLFWFAALCVAFGFCGSQVSKTILAFLAKPFSTTLTVELNESEIKYFPAVTICNLNMISLSQYIITNRKWGIETGDVKNSTNEELAYEIMSFMSLMTYRGEGNKLLESAKEALYNSNPDYLKRGPLLGEVLESFSHTIDGILSFEWLGPCKWRGQKCTASNFTALPNLRMGRCYTFNSGAKNHPLLENPKIPGPTQGLRLKLNVQEEDHVTNFDSPMAGFKVLIHDQNEFPIVDELGFAIQPGTHTFASVSVTKFQNLASPFKTDCQSPKLAYSSYFGYPYSPGACIKQCMHDYLIEKCKCQPVHNITVGVDLCSIKDAFDCVFPALNGKLPDKVSHCATSCPSPCQLTQYNTKLSYASAVSSALSRTIPVYLKSLNEEDRRSFTVANVTPEQMQVYLQKNLASIDIFFEDLSYTHIQQKPVYDTWALLANLGGYTGLFLGMSLLTVLEFLEFFLIWCYNKIRGSPKEVQVNNDEINGIPNERPTSKSTEILTMFER